MAGNTFGEIFRLTSFGESHGEAIGGVIDGCPAGLSIDDKFIQDRMRTFAGLKLPMLEEVLHGTGNHA